MPKKKRRVIRSHGPKEVTGSTPVLVIGKGKERIGIVNDPRRTNAEALKGTKEIAARIRKRHKIPARASTVDKLGFKPELDPKTHKVFAIFRTPKRKRLIR